MCRYVQFKQTKKKRNGEKPDNNTSLFYLKMSQDACTRGKQTQK